MPIANQSKIQDYGIIGNGRSAALIAKDGSIDWLCWPRFDSPFLFGAILDDKKGGSWKIKPTMKSQIERRYIEDSNVLQTFFTCPTGKLFLTDFMTALSEEDKGLHLHPEHELIRRLECTQGEVEIETQFNPSPKYGQIQAKIQDLGKLGLRIEIGQELIALHAPIKFDLSHGDRAKAKIKLKAGETMSFSLTYNLEGPAIIPPMTKEFVNYKLSKTVDWWQTWARKSTYNGPYKNYVTRSALTLKLLGYAPSGAFVAAATTSLPERLKGDLNWDYRYCWLRDAAFTMRSLLGLGYAEEAEAFTNWLLHSTRLTMPKLKAVYDVYGERMIQETELAYLKGFDSSRPVRIGIATRDQLQLDVYGEVIDGVAFFVQEGGNLDFDSKRMLRRLGHYVCKNWKRIDSGIWEERGDIRDFTFSRLMCWAALDKLISMKKGCNLSDRDIEEFEKNRTLIRSEIEEKAWNSEMEAYTSYLKGNMMDACVLLMPSFGFDKASSMRMQKTFKKIREILEVSPGIIYRYEKSFNQEGAFLLCSFWKVDFMARGGSSLQEAHRVFNEILEYSNDLGLFSEEIDPETKELLGNFPQAFTHIGLINTALILEEKGKNELG